MPSAVNSFIGGNVKYDESIKMHSLTKVTHICVQQCFGLIIFMTACLPFLPYHYHTHHISSSTSDLPPFLFTRDSIAINIHLLLHIKDLFISMDIYRARDILSQELQKKPLEIGFLSQENEYLPIHKPIHYAKYVTCQHQEFQQISQLVPTDKDKVAENGQVKIQATLKHPYTAFGLFIINDGETNHHQTGVIVHSKYAIITYSHPFQLTEGRTATFYPAINDNLFRKAYRVNSLVHDTKNPFAMIELDTDQDLSDIYGKVDIETTIERREGRGQRRPRGGRRRQPRGRDERRENREVPLHPISIRYKILGDKIILTSIPIRQERRRQNNPIYPEKGFLVEFDHEVRMMVKGVISNNTNNLISQADLKALTERVSSQPKVLSCLGMNLTRLQCIWIASRKWDEVTQINLTYNQIGEQICSHFQNASWQNIKVLNMSLNAIKEKGVYYLTKIKMPALEALELRNCVIQNQGCKWLSKGNWKHLKSLNLRTNGISQEGCKWLKEADWPQLKELNLKKNSIGRGCEHLTTARWNLEILQLGKCLIDDKGCKDISHANWPSLTFLGLENNLINDAGAKWLSKGNWKDLKLLLLRNNDAISKKGFDYLSKINASLLYKLSLSNSSNFPQNLTLILKSEFPFLSKMNLVVVRDHNHRRRGRGEEQDGEKKIKEFTKTLMKKYRYCRLQEEREEDDDDW